MLVYLGKVLLTKTGSPKKGIKMTELELHMKGTLGVGESTQRSADSYFHIILFNKGNRFCRTSTQLAPEFKLFSLSTSDGNRTALN